MNAYITEFFALCPNNSIRIKYRLRIETTEILPVEDISVTVEHMGEGYHEELADRLHLRFGGRQVLTADHHSVTIETTRSSECHGEGVL